MNSKILANFFGYILAIIAILVGCSTRPRPAKLAVPKQPDLLVETIRNDYARTDHIDDMRLRKFNRVLKISIRNQGGPPAGDTQIAVWDGEPGRGGTLIGTTTVPPIQGVYPLKDGIPIVGGLEKVEFVWNIRGKGGKRYICIEVDTSNDVDESDETNNITCKWFSLPKEAFFVTTNASLYDPEDIVLINVEAVNLVPDTALDLTVMLRVKYGGLTPYGEEVFNLRIPANEMVSKTIPYTTSYGSGGIYEIEVFAVKPERVRGYAWTQFRVSDSAHFTSFSTLRGTPPLTITFYNYSTPIGQIDKRLWDFGDGSISSDTNPIHIYTRPGIYTVTLTTTVGLSTYTRTRPSYVTVLPPE